MMEKKEMTLTSREDTLLGDPCKRSKEVTAGQGHFIEG